ncbi:phosphoglycolate phosphatase [Paracoccus subflavus]|uniref:Phosphoglycolate phosphatase n=1 Tax=Paracoccus subflavus TaxID=2528244 RepID=A0A4Q9FXG6_9RHOB|nr:phosphoglycolate phosphatase [Paracoccus subflavus]TBN38369.1 phosphoglycolate phosphatase [Paracoccus subflavus]
MSGALVFDLDGTLVDSAPDLHAAANRMLADVGAMPLTLQRLTSFIGHGIPNLVRLVMEDRGIPASRSAEMNAAMLTHYTASPATLTRPYGHVPETLAALKAGGYRLGVCTNKLRAPSISILEALDLLRFFDVVIGGDSLPEKKPDPAPLQAAFAALAAPRLLYIGDSEVDAETARRADVPFALYAHGYRKTPAEELPHLFVFEDFLSLPGRIDAMKADMPS